MATNLVVTYIAISMSYSPPLVSIIIPNYNHDKYLIQRLESVFNQTYENFEVIILDDSSTDNSKKLINFYKDNSRISLIIYNETNSGSPFKQWAKGIELARGEYIWIAESDDWSEVSFLSEVMKYAILFPQASLLYTESYLVKANKYELMGPTIDKLYYIFNPNELIEERLLNGISIYNGSAVVFKKEIGLKYTSELSKFYKHGDYLFWILVSLNRHTIFINKPLNYFRILPTSVTRHSVNSVRTLMEHFEIFCLLITFLKQNIFEFKKQYSFYNCWAIKFSTIIKSLNLDNRLKWFSILIKATRYNLYFSYRLFYHILKS